ncbi:MAG: hypothetical protein KDD06_08420 [Phaeodactylibacter sp.]|nr:hypothetical protein [Phaeodactylibacter sp.]MCB9266203.1 hypothetical protein [Lewinellaceae bacterium]MCB9286260.1 hypothetical protein [Lewinellaceae bacterium]
MKLSANYLYDLLPAYYRVIDQERGGPLRALVEILAREGKLVEDNITQLYENWFIETCDEWVVPYIGDLLGVRNIHEVEEAAVFSRRAYVANTLGYRRRKGTAPVLEQLALDVTGWQSKVVEFFQLLRYNQNLNHLRLHSTATPGLRQMNALELVHTAFDKESHTVDVRRITTGEGLYNIQNIGLYLWRLQQYLIGEKHISGENDAGKKRNVDARKINPADPESCYTFCPLGLDKHLFNNPRTEKDIVHLAEEINVPGLLRRRVLHDELEAVRQALVDGTSYHPTYFADEHPPVFQIFINGSTTAIPLKEITICNLSGCRKAPETKTYKEYLSDGSVSLVDMPITAAVDPVLGRIAFSDPGSIDYVLVNYTYGFSGDVGGGPYSRQASLSELTPEEIGWHVGVSRDKPAVGLETIHTTLWDAIDEWNSGPADTGLITILDNRTYEEALTGMRRILIPEGKRLYIIAADWTIQDPDGTPHRSKGVFTPDEIRPHILGDIEVEGTAPSTSSDGGGLLLNGLWVEGKLTVLSGNLKTCSLKHTTLVPDNGGLEVEPQESLIELNCERCILGPVLAPSEDALVSLEGSIIDHQAGAAISVPNGQLAVQKCTVFGTVDAQVLDAGNSIFMDLVEVVRRQVGCVRFCYLPIDSTTPRRYRCQPELEIQSQIKTLEGQGPVSNAQKLAIRSQVLNWLFPVFNSIQYGHHAYAQLGTLSPSQVTTGAENAAEMGVFNFLQQPQRVANLQIVLEEYLRLGLEAGIIYVT